MKHVVLMCLVFLMASPAWADWGLSNVVKKEIHRTTPAGAAPAEALPAQPAEAAVPGAAPASPPAAQAQEILYTKTTHYPYTIHLSSTQDLAQARKQLEHMKGRLGEMVFITKINLGTKGTWYRIDYGTFANVKEAVLKLESLKTKGLAARDVFVGTSVPFAIELGMFKTRQEAQAAAGNLAGKGMAPYVVKEKDDLYRLLYGAYPDEKSAAPAMSDLMSLNLQPTLKKR